MEEHIPIIVGVWCNHGFGLWNIDVFPNATLARHRGNGFAGSLYEHYICSHVVDDPGEVNIGPRDPIKPSGPFGK